MSPPRGRSPPDPGRAARSRPGRAAGFASSWIGVKYPADRTGLSRAKFWGPGPVAVSPAVPDGPPGVAHRQEVGKDHRITR